MSTPLIDRIFLRVQNKDGKWDSLSLRECWEMEGDFADAAREAVQEFVVRRAEDFKLLNLEQMEHVVASLPSDSYVSLKDGV